MKTYIGVGKTLKEKLDWGILVEDTDNNIKEVIYMECEDRYYIYKIDFADLHKLFIDDYDRSLERDILDYSEGRRLFDFLKMDICYQLDVLIAVLGKRAILGYPNSPAYSHEEIEAYILNNMNNDNKE